MFQAYRVFGRRGFALLLYPVVFYFFAFGSKARRASREFLSRVQADPSSSLFGKRDLGWRSSFKHFLTFGDAILDKLAAWTGTIGLEDVVYENFGTFEPLIRRQQGALLIASHLGNSEVSRAIGQLTPGIRILVLVHTRHSGNFNRMMQQANPNALVSLLQIDEIGPDTAILLQESVDRGEFIVIAGDRTPVRSSGRISWASFLGRDAPFPNGPFILASLLKCPVRLLFCIKKHGKHHIIFEDFSNKVEVPRQSREVALEGYVRRYAERLAVYAKRYPYQWFNFFDFWSQADPISGGS